MAGVVRLIHSCPLESASSVVPIEVVLRSRIQLVVTLLISAFLGPLKEKSSAERWFAIPWLDALHACACWTHWRQRLHCGQLIIPSAPITCIWASAKTLSKEGTIMYWPWLELPSFILRLMPTLSVCMSGGVMTSTKLQSYMQGGCNECSLVPQSSSMFPPWRVHPPDEKPAQMAASSNWPTRWLTDKDSRHVTRLVELASLGRFGPTMTILIIAQSWV